MATIKVDDPDAALSELGTLLGFALDRVTGAKRARRVDLLAV